MFGLFDSKSEKLVKKAYKIFREYLACHMRVLKNPDSEFWIKYFYETELHLEEIFEDIRLECGEEYLNNLQKNLEIEQKKSLYQFSEEEFDFIQSKKHEYKMRNKIWRL